MANISQNKRYVGVKETVLYGIANGGQVIGYNMVRNQLTFFLVTVFGVPAQAVATMIFVMGLWDAFNDPLMGSVVDRTRTRFGKLRPYLMFVPLPLGVATVLFFGGATFLDGVESTGLKIAYMCITYFIWEMLYTIGDIPYWGLSAAISPNPADRSRVITSARFISSIIGGLPGIIVPVCIDLSRNGSIPFTMAQVFLFLGVVAGTVGMGLFSLAGFFTKERIIRNSDEPKVFDCFRYLFKNKPLLLLVFSSVLGTVGGIADIFMQYFYTFSTGTASLSLVAGIPGTIAGYFTYLIMPKIEKLDSKKLIVRISFLKAAVAGVIFLAGCKFYTNPLVVVPLLAVQGIFNSLVSSIMLVIPTKMTGDTVDYMEWKTGERNEGMTFSLLTFVSKLTGSFGTAFATAIIPLIGLSQVGSDLVLVESGVNTRLWLWGLVTFIPAALNLLSLIPYIFYDLSGDKLAQIRKELEERRISENK
ncbi:MAG: MFS transporter [Clostridia bacterium]|nr:MFS transporter [Clostridia bacterium]